MESKHYNKRLSGHIAYLSKHNHYADKIKYNICGQSSRVDLVLKYCSDVLHIMSFIVLNIELHFFVLSFEKIFDDFSLFNSS